MKQKTMFRCIKRLNRWTNSHSDTLATIISVLCIIAYIITCGITHKSYKSEVNTYDTYNYEYLSSVVDTIWDKNAKILNPKDLPDDVIIEEYSQNTSSGIDFKCTLNTTNNIVNDPFISVHISDDFETVETTYFTESEYIADGRNSLIGCYLANFFLVCAIAIILVCLISVLACVVCWVFDLSIMFITFIKWIFLKLYAK